jgi:alkylglycerol monooxygenase
MHLNYSALAVPAFFIFLGLEYLTAIRQRKDYFNFAASVSSITIGLAERLMSLFISLSFYHVFYYVYQHWALFRISNNWIVWVSLILATDLVWYWYHRFGHEINLLWGAHVVHHQSEEYNYTVSARITVFQSFVRNFFWCILPLIGFHPAMVVITLVIHGTYSFFTHTRVVGKLGWLEYVLITPSHHRVHHASNEKYLNKNYGDLFIFWDKLFGTFQKEEEEPVYGLTHPLKSHSFIWQHFHYFAEMIEGVRGAGSTRRAFRIIFGKPEILDQQIRTDLERRFLPRKKQLSPTFIFKAYLNIQLIVSSILLFVLILFVDWYDTPEKIFTALIILVTMINCGALLEQRTWIFYLEYMRLFLITGFLSYEVQSVHFFALTILLVSVFILGLPVRKWYWKFIYGIAKN